MKEGDRIVNSGSSLAEKIAVHIQKNVENVVDVVTKRRKIAQQKARNVAAAGKSDTLHMFVKVIPKEMDHKKAKELSLLFILEKCMWTRNQEDQQLLVESSRVHTHL